MLPPVSYIKPEMIFIPGGTFQMGSNKYDFEKPIHSVTLDSFYMGKYPVTNKEYKLFNPEHKGQWSDPDYPVETVSWYDAVDYCNWLSNKESLEKCYSSNENNILCDFKKNGYRLPGEAEWEYACRAGTDTEYYWGDNMNGDYCWYEDNSGGQVNKVCQKKPNAWSLYDMLGNVWEWCWDWYDIDYYKISQSKNPKGPSSGLIKVFRGGCWYYFADDCRSSFRNFTLPVSADSSIGFRPVRYEL